MTCNYICPNGHAGHGSASAGTCSKCGATLAHNQAFHANDNKPAATPQVSPIIQNPAPATPTAEPAQNAKGVWHWTCAKGCPGGGGGAGSCGTCGGPLSHNQAYHDS